MPTQDSVVVLSYATCSTCRKALAWLKQTGIAAVVRPIALLPPTMTELATWLPQSGLPIRKWLNTSGQSYRTLGKQAFDKCSDTEIMHLISKDGKLVKRPILIAGHCVLVGFNEAAYAQLFKTT